MFGLLKSVGELALVVAKVAAAPVEIVVGVAGAAIKPIADAAALLVEDVKSLKD